MNKDVLRSKHWSRVKNLCSCVITNPQLDKTVTFKKLYAMSLCKNNYKRQSHLSKTIKNVSPDWWVKLFTHRFSDIRFAFHTILKDSNSEFVSRGGSDSLYHRVLLSMLTVEMIFLSFKSLSHRWLMKSRLIIVLQDYVFMTLDWKLRYLFIGSPLM